LIKIFLNILKQGWPYALAFYFANKLAQAFIMTASDDIMIRLQSLEHTLPLAFSNPLPSMQQEPLLVGGVAIFFVFFAIQNAKSKKKKFRDGVEHGSAKWGA